MVSHVTVPEDQQKSLEELAGKGGIVCPHPYSCLTIIPTFGRPDGTG
jgi:hypothetical protein